MLGEEKDERRDKLEREEKSGLFTPASRLPALNVLSGKTVAPKYVKRNMLGTHTVSNKGLKFSIKIDLCEITRRRNLFLESFLCLSGPTNLIEHFCVN